MNRQRSMRRRWLLGMAVTGCLAILLAAKAGSFLVLDAPQPSDVILVLAGETDVRPQRALELLEQGYGHRENLQNCSLSIFVFLCVSVTLRWKPF